MAEYIDRNLLREEMKKAWIDTRIVDEQPTSDVKEVIKGHKVAAVRETVTLDWECSECGCCMLVSTVHRTEGAIPW